MRYLFILALIALSACEFDSTIYYWVDPDAKQYVDKFYLEAEQRGVILQKTNLSVSFFNLNKFGETDSRSKEILVRIDSDLLNTYGKEYSTEIEVIVFHELGHALLGRPHFDGALAVMNTSPCINCYKDDALKRSRLLDDLITPRTSR